MRSAHIDLLLDDASVDLLVDGDANGGLGHVEHNAGSSVVVLERHTLVDRRVDLDVNIVTSLFNKVTRADESVEVSKTKVWKKPITLKFRKKVVVGHLPLVLNAFLKRVLVAAR